MTLSRILLVHPDPVVLEALQSALVPLGCAIHQATGDLAALPLLADAPDAALLGVCPRDAHCLELLTYIRHKHPRVPVVILFDADHPGRHAEAIAKDANAVLNLPVPPRLLRTCVTRAVAEKSSRPFREGLEAPEPEIIREALEACGRCRRATARALGIHLATLERRMRRLGLDDGGRRRRRIAPK